MNREKSGELAGRVHVGGTEFRFPGDRAGFIEMGYFAGCQYFPG